MLKYFKRLKIYKTSGNNLTFNPESGRGYSYSWYRIVDRVNGQYVLNTYRYSVTTAKHVRQLRSLLISLNISYLEIEAPQGLQSLDFASDCYIRAIKNANELLNKPRIRQATKDKTKQEIERLESKLELIKGIENSKMYGYPVDSNVNKLI